ncbi:hypothetical protein TPHA_0F03450 [Tetrapisispora phaffii CBS 4417]|uniref:Uncharacterized protein n=1 Tax=Tetrapisispora phaffii (strain ATCC 24235 / CBS 4417 / NBRC 1672 / NRRL Y-8282 / UCD 70-5) TaxID=1071381 RepID=G8BUN9_TETPH|nr:hypothetical protein TPHA_0F03450 [Tetrapisispora phaffii CBS 4417]CCE63825.1 hypothetical protein TPHA_0F03450 [Tetrapisispora phaffii CBS 4417]
MLRFKWLYSLNPKTFADLNERKFKNYRFGTLASYLFFVIIMNILKVALFISDIYTCVKLLAFNSWGNNLIKPYLSFKISKWLFSGCIFFSIVLLIWEFIRSIRVYKTKNIALSYINGFCKHYYSLKNYAIFCFFEELSVDSKFQQVAFFTFFEMKSCFRFLFADTPRQVINGLTLWSVLISESNGKNLSDLESASNLLQKIKYIAQTNHEEAILLSFMLFSFAIWCIFFIKFTIAVICLLYVYHKLITKQKYKGLREYVCISINNKVDYLIKENTDKICDKNRMSYSDLGLQSRSRYNANPIHENNVKDKETYQQSAFNTSTEQLLEIEYLTRGKYKDAEYEFDEFKVDPNVKILQDINDLEEYSDINNYEQYPTHDIDMENTDKPLRLSSMIMDPALSYFRDEIYTFDVQKQFQPLQRQPTSSSGNSSESGVDNVRPDNLTHKIYNLSNSTVESYVCSSEKSCNIFNSANTANYNIRSSKVNLDPLDTTNVYKTKLLLNNNFNGSNLEIMDKVYKTHHNFNIYTPSLAHFDQSKKDFHNEPDDLPI